jgi:hypothetical protein
MGDGVSAHLQNLRISLLHLGFERAKGAGRKDALTQDFKQMGTVYI